MALLEKIDQDVKQAMIAKDSARLEALRFLKSAIKYAAIEKTGAAFTDADVQQVIQKQIKQRKESIAQFSSNGRPDLAAKESSEVLILEAYLPAQVSDDELRTILLEQIKACGATQKKDFGKVMKQSVDILSGRADNKRISELLGKLLP